MFDKMNAFLLNYKNLGNFLESDCPEMGPIVRTKITVIIHLICVSTQHLLKN